MPPPRFLLFHLGPPQPAPDPSRYSSICNRHLTEELEEEERGEKVLCLLRGVNAPPPLSPISWTHLHLLSSFLGSHISYFSFLHFLQLPRTEPLFMCK